MLSALHLCKQIMSIKPSLLHAQHMKPTGVRDDTCEVCNVIYLDELMKASMHMFIKIVKVSVNPIPAVILFFESTAVVDGGVIQLACRVQKSSHTVDCAIIRFFDISG